jgi:photosystem II stability/assembly factor-like uncharacterized protein
MARPNFVLHLTISAGMISAPIWAQDAAKTVDAGASPADPSTKPEPLAKGEEAYFTALKWRNIGPDRGGRSISSAGSVARPLEYYFAAVGGGLWKTTDGGTSWASVTDGQLDTASVGGVAVCEANPGIVYLTTGETQLRGNILPGNGVWKSVDAGKTWKKVGLQDVQNFSRVRIHPKSCETVYVGGFGHYGQPNQDRGVYKTSDGGKNWQKVLYRDPRTGAVDISIDPNNPETVYAALWEAWRKPWGMSSGGVGSGLFKSTDGGGTWTELTRRKGLPQTGLIGKIGVSVSPADSKRVYAIVEHQDGGVFTSDDGGESWARTNDSRDLRQRAFYYSRLVADPKVKDRVYVLNVDFFRSDDGGKTFPTKIKVPHGDNHDLWIAANDNQRMIQSNDGGANVSVNGGTSWTKQNYPTAQMYRVSISNHFPYFVCGGQQDNSTICVPSRDWKHVNVLGGKYGFAAGGGESGYVTNDPRNPNIFYSGSYGGTLDRFDYATGQERRINVNPDNPMGYSAGDIAERFQWTYPIVFDPHEPGTLYVTSQHVWRSRDEGQSWEKISPDLTRHDPATLGPSGGPITLDQTGVETYATVFALAPSRLERGVIWAGSDDGMVHITRDSGGTWSDITPARLPANLKITTIEESPHQPGTAYLTGHRFLLGDFRPYVMKTANYGRSWQAISAGIPADEMARSIRVDPKRPGLLYLGTERGVWVSFNDGGRWHKLRRNLPAVQVSDLAVTDRDLVIATHGRSFWVMDDVGVLRQLETGSARRQRLFAPSAATRGVDEGVAIDYFLPRAPRKLTLDILSADGKPIHSFKGSPKDYKPPSEDDDDDGPPPVPTAGMKPGLNRFVWNMRYPGFSEFPGMIMWTSRNRGITALPGKYQARLTIDGTTQVQEFEVRRDARVANVAPADLERRFELANRISARVSQANEAVSLIRGIKAQTATVAGKIKAPALQTDLAGFGDKLSAIEGRLYQVRNRSRQDPLNYPIMLNDKLAGLIGTVESAEAPPTAQTEQAFTELSGQLDGHLAELNRLLDAELPALNQRLTAEGLASIKRRQ